MIKEKNIYKRRESLLFLVLWLFVFVSPVMLSMGSKRLDSIRLIHEWIKILPFFAVFCINNFLIFKYFVGKQTVKYFVLIVASILLMAIPATFIPVLYDLFHIQVPNQPQDTKRDTFFYLNNYFYNVIFGILTVGVNNAIKIASKWIEDKEKLERLEKENLRIQLANLQHQVSPHFFMNTLNNIYSLVELDKTKAREAIMKLSKLMRYLLYENKTGNTLLSKEFEFIRSYVDLMKLRYADEVTINLVIPSSYNDTAIPMLLFTSYIENAFKYGSSYQQTSIIDINFEVDDEELIFTCSNTKAATIQAEMAGGLGLVNSKNRLDLLFGAKYSLDLLDLDDSFRVILKIPLQ